MKIYEINQKEKRPRAELLSARGPSRVGLRNSRGSQNLVVELDARAHYLELHDPERHSPSEELINRAHVAETNANLCADRILLPLFFRHAQFENWCDAGEVAVRRTHLVTREVVKGSQLVFSHPDTDNRYPILENPPTGFAHSVTFHDSSEGIQASVVVVGNHSSGTIHVITPFFLDLEMYYRANIAQLLSRDKYSIITILRQAQTKNQHFCCFYDLNLMDSMIKKFSSPKMRNRQFVFAPKNPYDLVAEPRLRRGEALTFPTWCAR